MLHIGSLGDFSGFPISNLSGRHMYAITCKASYAAQAYDIINPIIVSKVMVILLK